LRHTILSRTCIPIPPPRHLCDVSESVAKKVAYGNVKKKKPAPGADYVFCLLPPIYAGLRVFSYFLYSIVGSVNIKSIHSIITIAAGRIAPKAIDKIGLVSQNDQPEPTNRTNSRIFLCHCCEERRQKYKSHYIVVSTGFASRGRRHALSTQDVFRSHQV
jgi:hypothetical protein